MSNKNKIASIVVAFAVGLLIGLVIPVNLGSSSDLQGRAGAPAVTGDEQPKKVAPKEGLIPKQQPEPKRERNLPTENDESAVDPDANKPKLEF